MDKVYEQEDFSYEDDAVDETRRSNAKSKKALIVTLFMLSLLAAIYIGRSFYFRIRIAVSKTIECLLRSQNPFAWPQSSGIIAPFKRVNRFLSDKITYLVGSEF